MVSIYHLKQWLAALGLACLMFSSTLWAQTAATASGQSSPSVIVDVDARGQRFLALRAMPARVAIGDPDVADVQVLEAGQGRSAGLMLYGNRAGSTQLQVWMPGAQAPQQWTVRVMGSVQQALRDSGESQPHANVHAGAQQALITGTSPTLLDHRKATEAAAAASGRENIVDFGVIETPSMVQVEVKVVELSRNVMKEAGIDWSAGRGVSYSVFRNPISGGLTSIAGQMLEQGSDLAAETAIIAGSMPGVRPTWAGGSFGGGFNLFYSSADFLASLSLLETNGLGRILAEPTLVAMSGQSASFLAGGEIPVPVAGSQGTQGVDYKPFGIGLTVSPTVLASNRIVLKVAPESSDLDPNNGVPVISGDRTTVMPAIITRRADTTIELGDGESFVISGLVSRNTRAVVNKFPFLGDIPIIGTFFRNIQYTQDERELVIVVTPRLVRPFARGTHIPLPGEREEVVNSAGAGWGHYLLGPDMGDQMPGFSR